MPPFLSSAESTADGEFGVGGGCQKIYFQLKYYIFLAKMFALVLRNIGGPRWRGHPPGKSAVRIAGGPRGGLLVRCNVGKQFGFASINRNGYVMFGFFERIEVVSSSLLAVNTCISVFVSS